MAYIEKISLIAAALTPPFNRKLADVRSIVAQTPKIQFPPRIVPAGKTESNAS